MFLLYEIEFSMTRIILPVMSSKWKSDASSAVSNNPFERFSFEISFTRSFISSFRDMTLVKII